MGVTYAHRSLPINFSRRVLARLLLHERAMNYNGKSPMRLHCPKCNIFDGHPVIKTDPRHFHWGPGTEQLFRRIAGQDLSYRVHTRKCIHCGHPFEAAELSVHHLRALVTEVQRVEPLKAEIARTRLLVEALQEQLQQIVDIAQPIPKSPYGTTASHTRRA